MAALFSNVIPASENPALLVYTILFYIYLIYIYIYEYLL